MKLCRFRSPSHPWPRIGLFQDVDTILDLSSVGINSLETILEAEDPSHHLRSLGVRNPARVDLGAVTLLSPVENQEVWAAGVTYLRSKTARMEESEFSASAYDKVYAAPRPEIFFKSMPSKVVGPGGKVGIRNDAKWNVPEPELVLVINSRGAVVGYTVGNDMSSRDIEGENLLYLPQAKMYKDSCAVGPCVVLTDEATARNWTISISIVRDTIEIFTGETKVSQIKRGFGELAGWLTRSQEFPKGAMLFTGTGIVPPDTFTLAPGDRVSIDISGIGVLANEVATV